MQDPNKLLKTAVDDIVNHINGEKMSAHDAVVKTARDMDLNVHFIKRACEVINVALTYEHFRKHASDRGADFPIVDAQKVSAEIFPNTEPTIAEKKSQWFSGTIVEENVPNFLKAKSDPKFKRAFAELKALKDTPQETSDQGICEKAGYARQNMVQHLDNCRTELVGTKLELADKFASLVNGLSRDPAARTSFPDFEAQVYSKYGEEAVPYLDLIYKSASCPEPRGEHDAKHTAFDDSLEVILFGDLLKTADHYNAAMDRTAQAATDLAEMETKRAAAYQFLGEQRLQQLRAEDKEAATLVEGLVSKKAEVEEIDPVLALTQQKLAVIKDAEEAGAPSLADEAQHLTFSQRMLPPVLKTKIIAYKKKQAEVEEKDAGVAGTAWDTLLEQYKSQATPPGVGPANSPMDNLDRKLLIQNLMTTDPILRTYEPKKVVDSYEQFLRLAPELSTEKEIVRSHLRQMVASQAMTAFDGAQLIDANTKLLKQRMLESGAKPPRDDK